jgi:hypothetical protein
MNLKGLIEGAAAPAIMAVIMAVMLRAAQKGRPRVDAETGYLVLGYSRAMRALCLVFTLGFPISITTLLVARPPRNQGDVAAAYGLYAFAVPTLALLWESMRFALVIPLWP